MWPYVPGPAIINRWWVVSDTKANAVLNCLPHAGDLEGVVGSVGLRVAWAAIVPPSPSVCSAELCPEGVTSPLFFGVLHLRVVLQSCSSVLVDTSLSSTDSCKTASFF